MQFPVRIKFQKFHNNPKRNVSVSTYNVIFYRLYISKDYMYTITEIEIFNLYVDIDDRNLCYQLHENLARLYTREPYKATN